MLNVQNTLVSMHNCSESKGKAELALASLRQLNDDPTATTEFSANFSQPRKPGYQSRLRLPLNFRICLPL